MTAERMPALSLCPTKPSCRLVGIVLREQDSSFQSSFLLAQYNPCTLASNTTVAQHFATQHHFGAILEQQCGLKRDGAGKADWRGTAMPDDALRIFAP